MIIKNYETNKINFETNKFFLLYGTNEGAKKDTIDYIVNKTNISEIIKFDERQIIENNKIFFQEVLEKSLFEEKKIIIINRSSDKILKILENILDKEQEDLIVINSALLEKKSKLRNKFEKTKNLICIPHYQDNHETLSKIALSFFKEKKLNISQSNVNLLIRKCNGDRGVLEIELNKVNFYLMRGKKLTSENLSKLINLIENHSLSELVDNCLAKNEKKTLEMLNENIYSNEDCILIVRTFLNKCKRILELAKQFKYNKDLNLTLSSAKPPIFWKEKEIIRQQLNKLTPDKIKNIMFRLNKIELQIKKNLYNSMEIIKDFIINESAANSKN